MLIPVMYDIFNETIIKNVLFSLSCIAFELYSFGSWLIHRVDYDQERVAHIEAFCFEMHCILLSSALIAKLHVCEI